MAELSRDALQYLLDSGLLDANRFLEVLRDKQRPPTQVYADPRALGGEAAVLPGERLHIPGQGDVSSNVGPLDPVDILAGVLASPALSATKALGRQLAKPGPSVGSILRSQRGSVGAGGSDIDPLEALRQRIQAAMEKQGAPGRVPSQIPGEPRETYALRLKSFGRRFGIDDEYADFLRRYEQAPRGFEGPDDQLPAGAYDQGSGRTRDPWSEDIGTDDWSDFVDDLVSQMPDTRFEKPRRTRDLATGQDITSLPSSPSPARPEPSGDAQQYADIIRKLFEGGR